MYNELDGLTLNGSTISAKDGLSIAQKGDNIFPPNNTVWIANYPKRMSEDSMESLFSEVGRVRRITRHVIFLSMNFTH